MKTFWVAYLICIGCSPFNSCLFGERDKVAVLHNSREECADTGADAAAWREMIFDEQWEFECLPLSVQVRP